MANSVLEENQSKTYKQEIAKYTFICEGAGVVSEKSPEAKTLKPGIRLHFLRYGLFDRNSNLENETDVDAPKYENKSTTQKAVLLKDEKAIGGKINTNANSSMEATEPQVDLEEVEVLALKEMPGLDNFYTARTALSKGYIYLMNDNDPDDYYELEVDEYGYFSHILWEYNRDGNGDYLDLRESINEKLEYKVVDPGKKLWVAYSPVQWSRAYHEELNGNSEKRAERMRLIDCSGFKKGEENSHDDAIPFTEVKTVFSAEHPYANSLHSMLHSIHVDEQKQDETGDNDLLEDMFVVLHDPVGCALDISNVVEEKTIRFKALVDSVQSGEKIKDAFDRVASGNLEVPQPKNKECEQLFTLALTCYQLVYNDDKAILKYDGGSPGYFNFSDRHYLDPRPTHRMNYNNKAGIGRREKNDGHIGYGLDSEKLEGILGIKERNNARKELLSYRDDLGKMVGEDYIKLYLDDYLENHPERILDGRNVLLDIIDPLSYHPYKFDKHLMLQKEFVEEDKWVNLVYDVIDDKPSDKLKSKTVKSEAEAFSGLDPLLALLGAPLNMDKLLTKADGMSIKIAKAYKKNLKYRGQQASSFKEIKGVLYESIEEKQKFVVNKLNKNLKVWGEEMFEIVDDDIWMKLEKLGVELDPEYVKRGKYIGKREDILRILKESHGKDGFTYKTLKRKSGNVVEVNIKVVKNKTSDITAAKNYKISKILNGRAFNGVFAALELYNFGNALIKLTEEGSTKKDKVYAFGSAIKLIEASTSLRKAFIIASKRSVTPSFTKVATGLSVVGGAITSGWCFYDGIVAIDKSDVDSGLAMIGAGVAFGVSTAASLGTIAALGGPVGWIAALVGVGFLIIASLLTDEELETYFKNFLLHDKKFPKPIDMSPIAYSQSILDNRWELTDDDFRDTLMNPFDAQAKLLDYIVCKQISFTPIDPDKQDFSSSAPFGLAVNSSTSTASSFNAKMVFSRFFNHPDQVEAHAYFYPSGVRNGGAIDMNMHKPIKIYDTLSGEALQVAFSIPNKYKDQIRLQSEVVFALRLHIDKTQNLHFPYPLGGIQRFLGSKIRMQSLSAGIYVSSLNQKEDVTIATLSELKTKKAW